MSPLAQGPAAPRQAPQIALSIAGFDPSGGAGITADLLTFAAHGLFGTSCITALTVQSTIGVLAVHPVPDLIGPTLDYLTEDLPPAGIKIGMLGSAAAVSAVARFLRGPALAGIPIVLDPVILSSSGASLLGEEGIIALRRELLPAVTWITPNREEVCVLAGGVSPESSMRALLNDFPQLHIVCTGGDAPGQSAIDMLLVPAGAMQKFSAERISTTSTHGTGCAFSSSLLANLMLGRNPQNAIAAAKAYVTEALRTAPGLGRGRGPLQLLPARLEKYVADAHYPAERPAAKP